MFSSIKRLIGNITVEEKGDQIVIEGLPGDVINRDFTKVWSTSKLSSFLFTSLKSSSASFNQFFAPDFQYALRRLAYDRKARVNRRACMKILEELNNNTWLKNVEITQPSILDMKKLDVFHFKPLAKQLEFFKHYDQVKQAYRLNGYLLDADPGTGKTWTSVVLSHLLGCDVFIAIVPKNAVHDVWDKSLGSFFKKPVRYWTSLSGKPLDTSYSHFVFHYEQLPIAVEFFRKNIKHWKKPFIDLDECHNLNDDKSDRSLSFIELCNIVQSQDVLWMSGTPLKALGREVITMLKTIDPLFDADAEWRFREIFGSSSTRATDILANRLGILRFKIEAGEIYDNKLQEIPWPIKMPDSDKYLLDNIRQDMRDYVDMRIKHYVENMSVYVDQYFRGLDYFKRTLKSAGQKKDFETYQKHIADIREYYDPKSMKDMVVWCNRYEKKVIMPTLPKAIKEPFNKARSVVKYYYLVVQGEALGRVLGQARAQCIRDMVPYVNMPELIDQSNSKTVIFTSYVSALKGTMEYLEKEGYKPLAVFADTNADLKMILERFEKDPNVNPLVATFDSLSTAIPLLMASTGILLNSPFRSYEYKQTIARMDRKGQKEQVFIYNVVLDTGNEPNISSRSIDIMAWSKEQVEVLMGGKTRGLDLSMEAFQELVPDDEVKLTEAASNRPSFIGWV